MSSVNSFETDMRKLRRRRKSKRIIKNTLFIFFIIVIALAVYATRSVWMSYFDGILERAQNSVSSDIDGELAKGNYPLDISKKSDVNIGSMNKCWTLLADSEFYVYTESGEVIYSQQIKYSNPIINESEKRTLIYDLGGYGFMSLSNKKQVFEKTLTDQILLGAVGDDGTVAIVTSNDKYTSYLTVYDKNGSEIFRWSDSNMITAIDINSDGSGCSVSSSYARGGKYISVVSVIDFSSDKLVTKSEALPSLTFGVEHTNDGKLWVVTDNCLYRLNEQGKIDYMYSYKLDLDSFDFSEEVTALVFESIDNAHSAVTIVSYNENDAVELTGMSEITSVVVNGYSVYLCEKTKINVLDADGVNRFNMPLDGECKQFAVSDKDIYLMGYKLIDKIEITADGGKE